MNPADIRAVCVIPAYGQPGLLAEALASVMAQTLPGVAAVVVDDGCRLAETGVVAREAATLHPGRVHALRTRNGGLSAARNHGIGHALMAFPQARAVFMLDADNRLWPQCLARGLAQLDACPAEIGWLYPDIDAFGMRDCADCGGDFSPLSLILDNYCEAGSLLRREMLVAGLRYDETLREGWEDVDFFLRGLEAGYLGRHFPHAGFRYRRRAESMLAESDSMQPKLRADMQSRHPRLYTARHVMALEAAEAPRHAVILVGEDSARILHDPAEALPPKAAQATSPKAAQATSPQVAPATSPEAAPAAIPRAALRRQLCRAFADPTARHHPYAVVFASPAALDALQAARLLHWAFWFGALLLQRQPLAGLVLTGGTGLGLRHSPGAIDDAQIIFLRTEAALRVVTTDNAGASRWARTALADQAIRVELTLPDAPPEAIAAGEFLAEMAALADAATQAPPPPWRRRWRVTRDATAQHLRARLGHGLTLPRRVAGRNIGIIQPLHTRGGVERVLLRQAAVLRAQGWTPHLFITQAPEVELLPGTTDTYASINLLAVTGQEAWPDHSRDYFGAETAAFGAAPGAADALGAMLGMDAVLNTHSLAGHALAARLRRHGVRTLLGLHLVERGGFGEPVGQAHTALAYEHAYDMALVISAQLRGWCLGQGWPEAKLMLVRNAPGYASAAVPAPRMGGRLRAVFLGRLDAQKGLERLTAIIAATRDFVDWRVAGKPVLSGAPPELGVPVEPPAESAAELDALYGWADVLLLPSRFEGVPLTILEAQRLGCVPIATDVGAVAEIIAEGQDGILLPGQGSDAAISAAAVGALRRLDADRAALARLSDNAMARLATARWEDTMQPLLQWLDTQVPA